MQNRRVEHRGEEVVRRANRVNVAGEVQVEILHRHHLAQATTSGTPLQSEHRTERRLSQAGNRPLADHTQPLRKTNQRRRVADAGRRWRDASDTYQLAVTLARETVDNRQRNLRLVATVGLELARLQTDALSEQGDRLELRPLRNLQTAFHRAGPKRSQRVIRFHRFRFTAEAISHYGGLGGPHRLPTSYVTNLVTGCVTMEACTGAFTATG